MFGYIYKFTNLMNGKIYIGKREKNYFDESYYGSGKPGVTTIASCCRGDIKECKKSSTHWRYVDEN